MKLKNFSVFSLCGFFFISSCNDISSYSSMEGCENALIHSKHHREKYENALRRLYNGNDNLWNYAKKLKGDGVEIPGDLGSYSFTVNGRSPNQLTVYQHGDVIKLVTGHKLQISFINDVVGLGVFALTPLPAGLDLGYYMGELKSSSSVSDDESRLAWRLEEDLLIVPGCRSGRNYLRYINQDGNNGHLDNNVFEEASPFGIKYKTSRKIKLKEELTIGYGESYWRALSETPYSTSQHEAFPSHYKNMITSGQPGYFTNKSILDLSNENRAEYINPSLGGVEGSPYSTYRYDLLLKNEQGMFKVIAQEEIRTGEIIGEVVGELVAYKSLPKKNPHADYTYIVNEDYAIDATERGNILSFIAWGDRKDANCEMYTNEGRVYYRATKTVLPGSELLVCCDVE